ncbi:hypothetical protein [Clostridium novyi]|uniref:Uncharacterized protein n=1 Tax=Clostridium novyi (strain NT) TaxID=386415 RepID=A0Q0T8_CLONN|nr:hypothetical protein [Clostridium novyi]ABK60379.1 hypothetical protein NT01CX_2167 [Clostridium novyi NT]KEH85042.1 hypothetical protein Z965_11160 [Clostridium novyi A str. BKT29909]KEH88612.1 hypothetical protein Z966_00340 [Clostridium novyi A str. NCTC 538]
MNNEQLRAALIHKFPMKLEHADILIKEYGCIAFTIAYQLYNQGFIFTDLSYMNLDKALDQNKRFKKVVSKVIKTHQNNLKNYKDY